MTLRPLDPVWPQGGPSESLSHSEPGRGTAGESGPSCDQLVPGTIEQYFYGELSPAERDGVEAHLARCRPCRGALEDLAVIRVTLAARPIVAAPASNDWTGFMGRLGETLAREALDQRSHGTNRPAPKLDFGDHAASPHVHFFGFPGGVFFPVAR